MARRAAILVVVALIGCGKKPDDAPYVVIDVPQTSRTSGGANAFGVYASLGDRAESRAKTSLDARDTPGTRKKAIAEMEPLFSELAAATRSPCEFRFEPTAPFEARPHQLGWLLIGRALAWKIEEYVESGDWRSAVDWAVVAITFGLDLSGGSTSDATLGYGIVDGARRAIAPVVTSLPLESLVTLESGVREALSRLPDPDTTIESERAEMLTAVAAIQDADRSNTVDAFAAKLYGKSREAMKRYGDLKGNERNAMTKSLVDEVGAVTAQLRERASAFAAVRGQIEPTLSGDARALAEQFLYSGSLWLSSRDLTLARTRLLYLTAYLCRKIAEDGSAPIDLSLVEPRLRQDPYTGLDMGFVSLGKDFTVYSYGADGKDDRGDTDSERLKPDLLLESAL